MTFILLHRQISHLNEWIVILCFIKTFPTNRIHRIKFIQNFFIWSPRSCWSPLWRLKHTIVTCWHAEFTHGLLQLWFLLKRHWSGTVCWHSLYGCIGWPLDSIWMIIINYHCRWVVSLIHLLTVLLLKTILLLLKSISTVLIQLTHHSHSLWSASHVCFFIYLLKLCIWW